MCFSMRYVCFMIVIGWRVLLLLPFRETLQNWLRWLSGCFSYIQKSSRQTRRCAISATPLSCQPSRSTNACPALPHHRSPRNRYHCHCIASPDLDSASPAFDVVVAAINPFLRTSAYDVYLQTGATSAESLAQQPKPSLH